MLGAVTRELPSTFRQQTAAAVVTEAFFWGAVASGSLLLGAAVAALLPPGKKVLGLVMGFGAGVLISAVAFELMEEAVDVGGHAGATLGLFTGAATFTFGDILIGRFERRRRHSKGEVMGPRPACRSSSGHCSTVFRKRRCSG